MLPGNVSWARRKISEAFGTKLVFSSNLEGSDGAIRLCRKIVDEDPDRYFYPNQYGNESNPRGHYETTGREIWEQTGGRVTHFVTGIGTSGTVMGTGRRLKDYRKEIEVYAVEPDDALHGLEGLKHMASSHRPRDLQAPRSWTASCRSRTEEAWDVCEKLADRGGHPGRALVGRVRWRGRCASPGSWRRRASPG